MSSTSNFGLIEALKMSPKVEDMLRSLPKEIDTLSDDTLSDYTLSDDTLSSLPQEIVSHILSLMPTKFAVQTSILSKKWRYIWTLVTILNFDDTRNNPYHGLDRFTKFVDRVLNFKTSQLKLFRLKVYDFSVQKSSVLSWIDKAIALRVVELDIQVNQLDLPLSFFTCKTLTKLRLQLRACAKDNDWECPSSVNLPCLKTLDIIVYNNPLVNVLKLVHGCPMLESLSLEIACRREEEDYIFNIPTLKRLKMSYVSIVNKAINKIVLHVPNLEYLFVGGVLCSSFRTIDMSSLDEAYISLSYITYDRLWAELIKGVNGVKSLSIQNIPSTSLLPFFPNMKHLELKSSLHSTRILQFLDSCPELNHLYVEKCGKSSWIEPKSVPVCMLTTLTTIKFSNCNGQKSERHLLEYVLEKAKALETVTITWENLYIEAMELWEWLVKVPKVSRNYEIHFTGDHSLVYWYINRLC